MDHRKNKDTLEDRDKGKKRLNLQKSKRRVSENPGRKRDDENKDKKRTGNDKGKKENIADKGRHGELGRDYRKLAELPEDATSVPFLYISRNQAVDVSAKQENEEDKENTQEPTNYDERPKGNFRANQAAEPVFEAEDLSHPIKHKHHDLANKHPHRLSHNKHPHVLNQNHPEAPEITTEENLRRLQFRVPITHIVKHTVKHRKPDVDTLGQENQISSEKEKLPQKQNDWQPHQDPLGDKQVSPPPTEPTIDIVKPPKHTHHKRDLLQPQPPPVTKTALPKVNIAAFKHPEFPKDAKVSRQRAYDYDESKTGTPVEVRGSPYILTKPTNSAPFLYADPVIQQPNHELLPDANDIDRIVGKHVHHKSKLPTHETTLAVLKDFGVPEQRGILKLLNYDGNEPRECHFGGNMWAYYSNVLRTFCPINMQERYRGASMFSKCLTAVDVSQIDLKVEEELKHQAEKRAVKSTVDGHLRKTCGDEEHFQYLKTLEDLQASTVPISHVYQMLLMVTPISRDVYLKYMRNMGIKNSLTIDAAKRYMALRQKFTSYSKLQLQPIDHIIAVSEWADTTEIEMLQLLSKDDTKRNTLFKDMNISNEDFERVQAQREERHKSIVDANKKVTDSQRESNTSNVTALINLAEDMK